MREWFPIAGGEKSTRPQLEAAATANDLYEGEVLFLTDEDRLVAATAPDDSVDCIMRHDTGTAGHKLPWCDEANEWEETQTTNGGWRANGSAGIGYNAQARGEAEQSVSRSHDVTLNAVCGTITLHGEAMGSRAVTCFDVENNCVEDGDLIVMNLIAPGANPADYTAVAINPIAGRFTVQVTCNAATGTGTRSDDLAVRFAILKA